MNYMITASFDSGHHPVAPPRRRGDAKRQELDFLMDGDAITVEKRRGALISIQTQLAQRQGQEVCRYGYRSCVQHSVGPKWRHATASHLERLPYFLDRVFPSRTATSTKVRQISAASLAVAAAVAAALSMHTAGSEL